MKWKRVLLGSLVMGFYLSNSCLYANEKSKSLLTPRKPITMKWTTLKGMNYFCAGEKISNLNSLETVISPLKDPEADRLLKLSRSSGSSGAIFLVGGSSLLVGGLITVGVDPHTGTGNRTIDTQQAVGLLVSLVGLLGDYVGAFKLAESKTAEFSAVQRYNAIVLGEDETSWNLRQPGIKAQLLTLKF